MTVQNANTVLFGTTGSSLKEVTNRKGTIPAGKVVRLKSDDTISIAKADGELLGVSLGGDLSNAGYTAVCRRGLRVPIQVTSAFSPVIGAVVSVDDVTGLAKAAGSGVTATAAVYVSGVLTDGGIQEDGTTGVRVALIDFPGGL